MRPGGADREDAGGGAEVAERPTCQATHTQPSAKHFPLPLVTLALTGGGGGVGVGTVEIGCAQPGAATTLGGTRQLLGQRSLRMRGETLCSAGLPRSSLHIK